MIGRANGPTLGTRTWAGSHHRADTAIRTAAKSKTNRSVLLLSRLNSNFVRVIGKY
jgi:hypothetical protein